MFAVASAFNVVPKVTVVPVKVGLELKLTASAYVWVVARMDVVLMSVVPSASLVMLVN